VSSSGFSPKKYPKCGAVPSIAENPTEEDEGDVEVVEAVDEKNSNSNFSSDEFEEDGLEAEAVSFFPRLITIFNPLYLFSRLQ
jgi:hypothetical protein